MTKLYKIPPSIEYEESEIFKDLILQYDNLIGRTLINGIEIFTLVINKFIDPVHIEDDIDIKKFNEIFYLFVICDIISDVDDTYYFIIPYISNYLDGPYDIDTRLSFIDFYLHGKTPDISKITLINDEMKHVPKIVHFLATIKFFKVETLKFGYLLNFISIDKFYVDFMKNKKQVNFIIAQYLYRVNKKESHQKFYNIPDFYKEVYSNIHIPNEQLSLIELPGVNEYLIKIVSILFKQNETEVLKDFVNNVVTGKEKEIILDFLSKIHYNRKIIIYI
jgi:hypothetical protein